MTADPFSNNTQNMASVMKYLKPILIALGLLGVIVATVGGIKAQQIGVMIESGKNAQMPPETVSVFQAQYQSWPNLYKAIGTVEADEGVTVSAQVPGKVTKINFKSGAEVKAGDVLIQQESINEEAKLNAAQARLKLAQSTYERLTELKVSKVASQSELDSARQQLDSAQGDVDDLKATLEKKLIRAPFDGRLGLRQIDLGTDLQVGTPIVSLQATHRVRVNFPVPQAWLPKMQQGLPVTVSLSAEHQPLAGVITAIGAEVSSVTRNIQVQSSLDNSQNLLLPGMAVNVEVTLSQPNQVLAVPSTALIYAPFGDTLFIVEGEAGKLSARQQFVQVGRSQGDFVEVLKGVNEGEKVVSAGAFKLFNNQPVVIGPNPTPEFSLNPSPADR